MVLRLLTLPLRVVRFLFSLVITVALVGGLGMAGYLQWRHPTEFESLLADGLSIGEGLDFLFGHPDALAVAVVLFFVAVALVLSSDSGSSRHSVDWDGDDGDGGGGFGGFGGDGGGGGGFGGGGDGGGGGGE